MSHSPSSSSAILYAPLSWQEARDIVASGRLERFGRSKEEQKRYERAQEQARKEYGSTEEWIRQSYNVDDGTCNTTNNNNNNHLHSRVVENAFPYYLQKGIRHDVLWTDGSCPPSPEQIEAIVAAGFPGREAVWFRNPKRLQSVPGIDHVHILSQAAP